MLSLNVTKGKQLTFEVQIGGASELSSQFKIVINEIEYGFPAKVGNETITVNLPPLNKVVANKLLEGDEAAVRLEIIADGHYLTPWEDRVTFANPLIVEAKIKESSPTFETKLIVEDGDIKPEAIKEEMTSDQKIEDLSSKLNQLIEMQEQSDLPPSPEKEEEDAEEEVKDKSVEEMLNKAIDKMKITEDKAAKKKAEIKEFKQNLTKEDIVRYIAKKGSKKQEVQDLIYEQAQTAAGSDSPPLILKEVAKILKK